MDPNTFQRNIFEALESEESRDGEICFDNPKDRVTFDRDLLT